MNIFSVDAVKREQEQVEFQKKIGMEVKRDKKVPMNITLPVEHKIKIQEYARKKHISASLVIQFWIEEFCNE